MDMAPIPGASFRGEDPLKRERMMNPRPEYWNVPLMRDAAVAERPAAQTDITRRYTEEAVRFIRDNASRPFFLYLAHTMPHMPLFASARFAGKSPRGRYGDVVEELDWSVGEVVDTLRALKLEKDTLVVFTSDNGPWLLFDEQGGSAGPLRGGKGGTFDGGVRVPMIAWWPGTIAPGVVTDMGSTLDFLPTIAALAGAAPPRDRVLDGFDLGPVLKARARSPREDMPYYRGPLLYAYRHGPYKAHLWTRSDVGDEPAVAHDPPLLYDVEVDPAERFDVAARHPDVIAEIKRRADALARTLQPVENQLVKVAK
jgi:arylsulfatase A-like enzyme